ncbi:TonB-dependent siderophore receptor [Marinomonas sp. A79]|uniref:TonB-dependent siderophore receptor n=1 Tax=Marinomonas vulgaris TaxID=2823372 RepID=A0ABS5HDR6_9GAMM|nr:TonB-dependent siderophore receptor [Marinomonas vulgaris]MBR7889760.1 TonB-dependent siderophore receptor [Marinomonas vulgaris]
MAHTHNTHSFRFPLAPLTLAISSALVLMAQPAIAEDANIELEQIEIVDSAEASYTVDNLSSPKYTQKLVDTPKTVNVINEAVLEDQGVTSLEDALRNVSGVSTFGAGEGGGNINTADNVTIRGFDANGSIYTDGIRDVAGYSRDTFNTESIEVAKGANGTISGKGSAGGSVNLVTKTAHLRGDKNSVTASYDEADMTRITGDFNKVLTEDSAIRLNIVGQTGGDYWDNGEENYETEAIAISYFDKLSEKTDLTVNFMHMQQDNTPVIGLPYIGEASAAILGVSAGPIGESYWDDYYGVEGLDFEEVEATTITAILNHQINDEWAFRNQTRFGKTNVKSIISRPYDNGDGTFDSNNAKTDFSENELIVSQFDFIGELYTGAVRHNLVIGAEIYQETQKTPDVTVTYSDSTATYDPLDPSTNTITGSYTTDGYSKDATATGLAAYFSDTATLNDKVQLSGGLRLEKYRLDADQTLTSRGTFIADVSEKSDADLISWNTGINFKPAKNGSIYLAYANNQSPNGDDLSLNGSSVAQVQEYISLDPLESTTAEVGTKWNFFNDRLLLSAAIFDTKTDTYDSDDDDNLIFGEEQSTGIELSTTGQLTETISVTASFTKQDTEVTEDYDADNEGDGLSSAPEKSAALWFAYNKEKLGLGIGAEYNSGITYWRQSKAYFTTDSVTLFNAMASYQFTENLSAQLNISNLTDETYITDYSAKGHFLPGYGRNAKATVKYDF